MVSPCLAIHGNPSKGSACASSLLSCLRTSPGTFPRGPAWRGVSLTSRGTVSKIQFYFQGIDLCMWSLSPLYKLRSGHRSIAFGGSHPIEEQGLLSSYSLPGLVLGSGMIFLNVESLRHLQREIIFFKITNCTRLCYKCLADDTNQELWRSLKESPDLGNQGRLHKRSILNSASNHG